jgi:RNA polymerase sigma-70 factor (ECF subfamily)
MSKQTILFMTTATFTTPVLRGDEDGAAALTLDDSGQVLSAHDKACDAEFERDALPWLDDVYRFALSLTRDESDADDIVQETFLRAYRSWHTFIPGTDCRRWLFTICRNVFLRSRERQRPMVDLEDGEQDAVAAGSVYAAARERGYDDLYARLDLAPALRDALDELAEPFRSAVILVDVEDMTYETAAQVMGVPIGTVRSRLFRGRRLLQEKLLTVAEDLGLVPTSAGDAR